MNRNIQLNPKTIIVEDSPLEAEAIKLLLKEYFPKVEVLGVVDDVEAGVRFISATNPDFVFMDVQLIAGTSYDILDQLENLNIPMNFEVIFYTGHLALDYKIRALSYASIDFLNRPFDVELFQKAVNKAIQRRNPQQYLKQFQLFMNMVRSAENIGTRLIIHKIRGVVEFVEIADIVYLEADAENTIFFLKNGTKIVSIRTLSKYDDLLINHHNFFSISSSIIINFEEMKVYNHAKRTIMMNDGQELGVTRRNGQILKEYINSITNLPSNKSFFDV